MKKNNSKNIIPFVNEEPFFLNHPEFTDEYIIKSINCSIDPTFFDKVSLNEYYLKEMGFGFDKDINFNSRLVLFQLDFARWFLNRH